MADPLRTVQISVPSGFIDLGRGDPAPSLLPLDLIRQAAERRLGQADNSFLQYGAEQGDGYFRAALAEFLSANCGYSADPETLFVSTGISSALDLLCTLFTRPGDTIFVEEPSYFLALRIFADHGLHVVPIQTDGSGLVTAALEEALKLERPKFLYLIPAFQNPSGQTLTLERREHLVALADKYGFLVLADEVYHLLAYDGQPPKSLGAYIEQENIVSLSSFSKILAPGLRLGWVQAHPKVIKRLAGCGLLDSGGGLNPFTSAVVREVIESGGLEQNIKKLISFYRERIAVMDSGLRKHLPGAAYAVPHGGYFFWVRLPGNLNAAQLQQSAESFQVGFRAGPRFSSRDGLQAYIRLCYAYYEPDQIQEGLRRLGECLASVI
jgi:DNA-binding transcriptional MocR family regulator